MDRQYAPLQVKQVRQGVLLCKPERGILRRIGLDGPATLVMTDFMVIPPPQWILPAPSIKGVSS